MVIYSCERCNKTFDQKYNYLKHLERKNPCKKNKRKIKPTLTDDKKQCHYCNKIFSRVDVLNKHLNQGHCEVKKETDNKMENKLMEMIDDMQKQIQELKAENKKYKQVINNQTNIEHQNNQTNNLNLNVIAFGKEDYSFITNATFKKILDKGFNSIPALVDELHFNKNKPEHHNIYISNIRDDYVLVYDGNDWNLQSRKDVLDSLYYSSSDTLETKFKELFDSLDKFTIRKFERFLDQKDDDNVINDIKKDLKVLLYNRRKVVRETKKLIDV
jgi:hypothetical protein